MTDSHDLRTAIPPIRVSTRRVWFSLAVNDAASPVGEAVNQPSDAARVARAIIGDEISECVLVLFLNARQRVTGYAEIARGKVNSAGFTPRDVLSPALLASAASIVIAHNHPSGDATPSRADRNATDELREAGELIGIALTDHIVVTAGDHFSFRENEGWE
jgi:DNA repair protein RadC